MLDPYDLVLIVLGVLLVLIAAALVWRRMRERAPTVAPYAVRDEILTRDERAMVPLIEQALGDGFRILFRIPLKDILQPTAASAKKHRKALEVLDGRTVPFLVCSADDFDPVAVISLGGDASRLPELSACGIAVLQFSPDPLPHPQEIRAEFERFLNDDRRKVKAAERENAEEDDWRIGSHLPPSEEEGGWLDGISPPPPAEIADAKEKSRGARDAQLFCPECGKAMMRRRMVRGPHAGREVWVCANFPDCRKTIPVLD